MKKIVLTLVVLAFQVNLLAQIASYNLDSNTVDQINGYNGVDTGSITFATENTLSFLQRDTDSYVTLPLALSQQFTNDSFQISFDYKVSTNNSNKVIISNAGNVGGFWDTAGFTIVQSGSEIILTIDDGQNSDDYVWIGFGNPELDTWKRYTLKVDLINKKYTTYVNDVETLDEALNNNFDKDAFLSAIQGKPITIGGINGSLNTQFNDTFSLENLQIYNQIPADLNSLKNAFNQLKEDILGNITLTEIEKNNYLDIIKGNLYFVSYTDIQTELFAYTNAYEANYPPLYEDGVEYYENELSTEARALLFAQNYVFETQFIDSNAQNMSGVVFEHHKVIPGEVEAGAINIASTNVEINGTYNIDIAAELLDQASVVRPTGYYLKPGDIVNITVPANIVNSGVTVIVGSHFRNMDTDYLGRINRFEDISLEYQLTSTTISVANPFGGGIYFKIPDGSNLGAFSTTIENAIKMPYFSLRAGNITTDADWLSQVANNKTPWADFESDKFMFTIPVDEIAGVTNPTEIMQKWDATMDAIRVASGRPLDRPRAEYYSFDTRLVTPAYGAGYPLIIPISELRMDDTWNPLKVLEGPRHYTLLHEMGHNHLHPTLAYDSGDPCHVLEAETVNHTLALSINNNVYNMSIDDAFGFSRVNTGGDPFTFEEAAFDWIITTNFRQNLPMGYDTSVPMTDKDMLKYQSRGWAKYADIVKLFGWQALGDTNGAFYNAGQQQSSTVCDWRGFVVGRDEYITAASNAVGKNLAPLFHFWGINPSTDTANQLSTMAKSQEIKALIEYYQCNVAPITMDDYLVFHNTIMPNTDYQWPRYEEYINQFDANFAQAIQDQFEFIKLEYGLIGLAAPSNLQESLNGNDTVDLSWTDNSTGETGFIVKMKGPSDDNFIVITTTLDNATSFTTNALTEIGEYQFQVTALNNENLESSICEVETIIVQYETLSINDFITTWKTDNTGTSTDFQITIPTNVTETYSYNVDWGDGNSDTGVTSDITHTYASIGTYTVKITGTFPQIYFNYSGDRNKILTIEQWGTNPWASMENAFYGCDNLNITNGSIDVPDLSNVASAESMFGAAGNFNGDVSAWDVSNISNMRFMFSECVSFNQDIGGWNVGNVVNMAEMFAFATFFNQNISSWNTIKVEAFNGMFANAEVFNQDISGWNVSNAIDMDSMFSEALAFNQDISSWNVSGVTRMGYMFANTEAFNQDISGWNVSNVIDMNSMFSGALVFNQDIGAWNMSNVTDMSWMFAFTDAFDQNLGAWDLTSVTQMEDMFTSSTLSTENYDNTLIGWATDSSGPGDGVDDIPNGITFSGGNSQFCNSETQRQSLIDTFGWTITDGGLDLLCNAIALSPKVYLQGTYINPNDVGLMNDALRVASLIPSTSPYTDLVTASSSVFDLGGTSGSGAIGDDIVDWIWVELRDENDNTTIIDSQSALLQRDGDVVGVDGISTLSFDQLAGNYYVAIAHRNHLGIITANTVSLSSSATVLDLSNDSALINGGTNAVVDLGNGSFALYAGDYDGNGQIQNSDLTQVTTLLGTSGYSDADSDMNSQVQNADINNIISPNVGNGEQSKNTNLKNNKPLIIAPLSTTHKRNKL